MSLLCLVNFDARFLGGSVPGTKDPKRLPLVTPNQKHFCVFDEIKLY